MSQQTALYERHVALGGRMVEFAGFSLPVQYTAGPKLEHLTVRQAAGLFDIDHMGQIDVSGPQALEYLQEMLTADLSTLQVGQAAYALMCNENGGIIDDTFVYRLSSSKSRCYMVVVNASNKATDTQWLLERASAFDVQVDNISPQTYMMALQGPTAEAILQPLCTADLSALPYHYAIEAELAGAPAIIGRTGYTGEDGFELYLPESKAVAIWDGIMASGEPHGLLPIGLAARDSLRFEAAMPLYGQELSLDINPIEAGLSWAVGWDKPSFIGREALRQVRQTGPDKRLIAFEMTERGVPRHDYRILVEGQPVGHVTSGMYAPSLDQFLGMGYVTRRYARRGREIGIEIRGKERRAIIVKRPFYTPTYRR